MKKRVLISYFIMGILFFIFNINGDTITGKATLQQLNMNILVTGSVSINILNPKNYNTYLTNESLPLNYSSNGAESVYYNLDGTSNLTLSSNTRFNTSEGSHTINIYANNTYGNLSSTNISFIANSSKFIINDSEFSIGDVVIINRNIRANKKGNSTDFLDFSFEDIQSLNNIVFDNPTYGEIIFKESINLTDDFNNTDNFINIGPNIVISSNKIVMNLDALINFKKNATLYINSNLNDPRVLLNNVVCPVTVCLKESYSSGLFKFNVSGLNGYSEFSLEETPVSPPGPGGGNTGNTGGGGSSGGGSTTSTKTTRPTTNQYFEVSTEVIKVTLKNGDSFKEKLTIKNIADKTQNFKLELSQSLVGLANIPESSFQILPGQEKTVELIFISLDDTKSDIYTGNLLITSEFASKTILIVDNIENKNALFDIELNIPERSKELYPGDELFADISLINLGRTGRIDAFLQFFIKDNKGNVLIAKEETIAVETSISLTRSFHIPANLKPGKYVVSVKVTYLDASSLSSDVFQINEKKETGLYILKYNLALIFIGISIIIMFIIILIFIYRSRKKNLQ